MLAKPAALNYPNWHNQGAYVSGARSALPNAGANPARLAQANALVAPLAPEKLSPAQAQAVNAMVAFSTLPKPPPGEARVGGGANSSETPPKFTFSKIDSANTPQMCTAKGGTVEQRNGQSMCKTKDDNNTTMQGVSTTR